MIVNSGAEVLGEIEHSKQVNTDRNTGEGFSLNKPQHDGNENHRRGNASADIPLEKHLDGSIYQSPDIIIHSQEINAVLNTAGSFEYSEAPNPIRIDKYIDGTIYQSPDIIVHPQEITLTFNSAETQLSIVSSGLPTTDPLFDSFSSFVESEFLPTFGPSIGFQADSNVSIHSLGVSQNANGIVDLSVRLLPIGAHANPYLSNISEHTIQSISSESKGTQSFRNIAYVGASQALVQEELNPVNSRVSGGASNNVVANALSNQAAKLESAQTIRTIEAVNNSYLLTGEIAKRNVLLTENQDGETLWYRDFEMDESSMLDLEKRLSTSEFVKNNDIQRVFINGELLWKREA